MGVIFFELLTSSVPFSSTSPEEAIRHHVTTSTPRRPSSAQRGGVPPKSTGFVLKCPRKEPRPEVPERGGVQRRHLSGYSVHEDEEKEPDIGGDTQPIPVFTDIPLDEREQGRKEEAEEEWEEKEEKEEEERKRLLFAFHEKDLRNDLKVMLGRLGFEVLFADQRMEVLELLQAKPFEMVCIDANLAGIDGFEICRIMKNDPGFKTIPVSSS